MQVMKALSNKTRSDMVKFFLKRDSPTCVCQLGDEFDKEFSVLYRHMKQLIDANILDSKKEGRKLLCRVKNPEKVGKLLRLAEELEK